MERLDLALVRRGYAASRTQAQKLIDAGAVRARIAGQWQTLQRAAEKFDERVTFEVAAIDELQYASRGGLKMALALSSLSASGRLTAEPGTRLHGSAVLDVGQSTGGFTDCALREGARQVVGVDVGRDQLAPQLRAHPQVVCLEGVNARQLPLADLQSLTPDGFDWIVMDVSFISQTLILPQLPGLLKDGGYLLSLVKPQFEVGPGGLGKNGIVKSTEFLAAAREKVVQAAADQGLQIGDYFDCGIAGGDGNRESFLFCRKPAPAAGD